jgi:hypothetical protein
MRRPRRSSLQELVNVDARLAQNSAECSFSHISTVVGQGNLAARRRFPPNFVAAWTGAIKGEPESPEFASDLAILEARKAAH